MVHILKIIHPKESQHIEINKILDELNIESREPKETMMTYARNSQMNSSLHILPNISDPEFCREKIKQKIKDEYKLTDKTVIEVKSKDDFIPEN